MNAKVLKHYDGTIRTVSTSDEGTLIIECELVQPRSMRGRNICIYFDREEVIELMKECKASAIHARRKPLTAS